MYNFHIHTLFCDGKASPEAFIEKAIALKMKTVGFSAHAPVPFDNPWSLKDNNVGAYSHTIDKLQALYGNQINILKSLEADFIPGITRDFSYWTDTYKLDYLIGSVHLVKIPGTSDLWFIDGSAANYEKGIQLFFGGDIQKAVEAYYKQIIDMLQHQKLDIVGHLDKVKMHNRERFFSEEDSWYRKLVDEVLDVIALKDVVVEINTRGIYSGKYPRLYPDVYIIEQCHIRGIPLTLNADAHHPEELMGHYPETVNVLQQLGISVLTVFEKRDRKKIAIERFI